MKATEQELDRQLDIELQGTFPASDPPTITQYPSTRTVSNPVSDLAGAILNTSSDAIIATDRAGNITFWNPGAARIFGFTADEALGRSLDLIIPENLKARHWRGYFHVMETGVSRYGQGDLLSVPGLTKSGSRISVEFTIVLLRDPQGRLTGTAAILRDVTRRFEELRELKRQLRMGGSLP